MLVIRLLRTGKVNQPSFRIVVCDRKKSSTAGSFCEEVGFVNRITGQKKILKDRMQYWISKGAKPSDTVYNLLVDENILEGKKIPVHKVKKASEGSAEAAPAEAQEKPKE